MEASHPIPWARVFITEGSTNPVYIFNAELWCDDCGRRIAAEITAEGNAPECPSDEHTYDSDDFPKYSDEDNEYTDSPNHCASGAECPNAEIIDGERYGCLLRETLTPDGERYVSEAEGPVAEFWRSEFDIDGPETLCEYYMFGGETFTLKLGDARYCAQQGDCDAYVSDTLRLPYIAAQFEVLSPEAIRKDLREFGAWDAEQLANDEENRARLLWGAACQIKEEKA